MARSRRSEASSRMSLIEQHTKPSDAPQAPIDSATDAAYLEGRWLEDTAPRPPMTVSESSNWHG